MCGDRHEVGEKFAPLPRLEKLPQYLINDLARRKTRFLGMCRNPLDVTHLHKVHLRLHGSVRLKIRHKRIYYFTKHGYNVV
jgi:hypothetical protein